MSVSKTIILVTGGKNGFVLDTYDLLASKPHYNVIIMGVRSLVKGCRALLKI